MMPRHGRGFYAAEVALAAAAVLARVAVEDLLPKAAARHADPQVVPGNGREIAYDEDHVPGLGSATQPAQGALFRVVAVHPLEAGGAGVLLVQGRFGAVEPVQGADELLQAAWPAIMIGFCL